MASESSATSSNTVQNKQHLATTHLEQTEPIFSQKMHKYRDDSPFYVPPISRTVKKHVICQFFTVVFVIYLWYIFNGGFIPKALIPHLPYLEVGPDVGPLLFFNVENDASKIRWSRETNSRQKVQEAMSSDKIEMIAGDVILRGQGTSQQTLVPVMAKPPATDSDITLKDWLDEIRAGTKGIKLHFHSMESVEISLQILNDFHKFKPMKFPVWLHVDVLQGPLGDKPVIDFKRFRKVQARLFPKCTLSFGWTTGTHTDLSQSAYTWDMVWDMLDLVEAENFEDQNIVFQARLSQMHNSVPQMKWLCDNTRQSLMVWHENIDHVVNEDVMYIAYRFPPEKAYFDLKHERLQLLLEQHRHFSRERLHHLVLRRDEVMVHPQMWLKMGFHIQKKSIYASTEAIVLASPIVYLVSKSKNLPTSELSIQGRVQFFNRGNRKAEDYRTGLNIFLRPSEYSDFDNIVAIRCFIGFGGEIMVSGNNLPEKLQFRKTARVTPTVANCYRFRIVDDKTQILFSVAPQHDCTTLESVEVEDAMLPILRVEVPRGLSTNEQRPYILKLDDNNRQALIDELSVKHT